MRRIEFAAGEIYHVYNRGVEKRDTFEVREDYERFLYVLLACNDHRPLFNSQFHYRGSTSIVRVAEKKRVPFVDLLCFCLMPNHFHLLLRQRENDSVPAYMQKVGTAYTMYFNTKYERSGALFQGRYKAIHVPRDTYFLHLTRYIHLNPLDLREPQWKERGIRQPGKVSRFLFDYPWSSYADYCGSSRFSFLLDTELLRSMFRSSEEYRRFVEAWTPRHLQRCAALTIEVQPR